ncbi:glutathione S-transferase family protein [Steroidobacter sp. S1-65]|uniref:Glutathione S-transferase family protein n=1 Tax=Steroidobacter gossypii TaxID=2805490 RepID=A0ABS1X5Y3_9GAMM|nr:glutathione S-transferase family protein [Steroidobacter gossypii]MBM0108642.1 glutathione S-transferase family protein [Steroidobacter gossypii]
MEPVLLYGVPQGCSFGSIVALEWLGQPYRLCRIRMTEDSRSDRYAKINPHGKTPALLLEDGRVLTESAAILQHIAARGIESGLGFAQGTREFDFFNQRLAFLTTTFFASFGPLWHAYMMEGNPRAQEVLRETGREWVADAHLKLESMLAGSDWLAGPRRTPADAYFIGLARWGTYHRVVEPGAYPRVQRFIDRLEADPAVIFAHAIEDERPAASSGGFRGHVSLEELLPRLAA